MNIPTNDLGFRISIDDVSCADLVTYGVTGYAPFKSTPIMVIGDEHQIMVDFGTTGFSPENEVTVDLDDLGITFKRRGVTTCAQVPMPTEV